MNDHASENKVRTFGKVTLMTRVMGFEELLSDMSELDLCPSFVVESA